MIERDNSEVELWLYRISTPCIVREDMGTGSTVPLGSSHWFPSVFPGTKPLSSGKKWKKPVSQKET